MKRFEYDITVNPASAFQQLVYFCTADGECSEEPAPTNLTSKLISKLNDRGREGWELVHVVLSPRGIVTFWKRHIEDRQ